jgi:hypothetical protein
MGRIDGLDVAAEVLENPFVDRERAVAAMRREAAPPTG